MTRVVLAEIYFRDYCDPSNPGDCAPDVYISEPGDAAEFQTQVREHGIGFASGPVEALEEFVQEQEVVDRLCCPTDPERDWDDSPCGLVMSEEEAVQELAKRELIDKLKELRDEGVI